MSQVRRLIFVRHAQRLDKYLREAYPSLKDWTQESFLNNQYYPLNMEFPLTVPGRSTVEHYLDDTPLSMMGEMCAQTLGNRIAEIGIQIDLAYSSPSLRCAQTCSRIIQGYSDLNGQQSFGIRIEGGLYEFGQFCKCVPTFMEPKFLSDRGMPIDMSYKSHTKLEELVHLAWESFTDFKKRGKKLLESVILKADPSVQTILFVTHAPTLLTFVRELMHKPLSEENLEHFSAEGNVMNKPSYAACVVLEKSADSKYWVPANPQPLPSFEIRAHTSFNQYWLDKKHYDVNE